MSAYNLHVRAVALTGLSDTIRSLGGKPRDLYDAVGLKHTLEGEPNGVVAWNKFANLLELAAREFDRPDFGMFWAERLKADFRNSGPTVLMSLLIPNIKTLLDATLRYQKFHTNGVRYSYAMTAPGEVTGYQDINPLSDPCPQMVEHIMAAITVMCRAHIQDWRIDFVGFTHAAISAPERYAEIFQCEIAFGQARNSMSAPASLLDQTMANRTATIIRPLLDPYIRWQSQRSGKIRASLAADIAALLPDMFASGLATLPDIAKVMDIPMKKLQRSLSAEGTSFSDLVERVRQQEARRMLRDTDLQIGQIALALGYASVPPFSVACKRWTGEPPRQYRRTLRANRPRQSRAAFRRSPKKDYPNT